MGTIANAKVTHYYNCYNGDFIGCLRCLPYTTNVKCSIKKLKDLNFIHSNPSIDTLYCSRYLF